MIHPDSYNCCGCSACEIICPTKAIDMRPDSLGFKYPYVNEEKCIKCSKCIKNCSFIQSKLSNMNIPTAYAARHIDKNVILNSRSGGIFTSLTDYILDNNGIVYGAITGYSLDVRHERADNRNTRDKMRGSKYAQSDISSIYSNLIEDLGNNHLVLFSGTPCQVDAIKKIVPKELQLNLILVDIICHGVGSPEVWSKFINSIERLNEDKIVSVDFRDKKKYGWSGLHKESFKLKNNPKPYYSKYIYYNDNHIRYSCFRCPYSSTNRISDLTLGDLWGWEKVVPEWKEVGECGCSLILSNTAKGENLLENIKLNTELKKVDLKDIIQPHLAHPLSEPAERIQYEKYFISNDFINVLNKYHLDIKPLLFTILKRKIKSLLKK